MFLEDLFKGDFQGIGGKWFSAILWKLLLALSGPANIVLPLKDNVKDSTVHNWG